MAINVLAMSGDWGKGNEANGGCRSRVDTRIYPGCADGARCT